MLNKFIRLVSYAMVHFVSFMSSLFLALFLVAPLICIVLSVVSLLKITPIMFMNNFALIYLIISLPLALVIFITIEIRAHKRLDVKKE